jgi:hypothetical protein
VIARGVFRIEPVEAALGIVRSLLLRHQQRKSIVFCQRRPAGPHIVTGGGLAAAMQNDHESGRLREMIGNEREHPELARIGAKTSGLDQGTVAGRRQVSREHSQAIEFIWIWQTSQEFDIFGKGHRQLLGERLLSSSPRTDSCCTAK